MYCNPFTHCRALFTEKCKDQPALLEAFLTLEKEFDALAVRVEDLEKGKGTIPPELEKRIADLETLASNLENEVNLQKIEINSINMLIETLQNDITSINNNISDLTNNKMQKDASNIENPSNVRDNILFAAAKDASNIEASNIDAWKEKLGIKTSFANFRVDADKTITSFPAILQLREAGATPIIDYLNITTTGRPICVNFQFVGKIASFTGYVHVLVDDIEIDEIGTFSWQDFRCFSATRIINVPAGSHKISFNVTTNGSTTLSIDSYQWLSCCVFEI